jgi:Fe-S cluster biogenesis protein NfuA
MAESTGEGRAGPEHAAVHQQLTRLDELLGQVEAIPGPAGELALDAISALTGMYGEALARVLAYAARAPALAESIIGDELLGHLLVLHDIHPDPVERRVARALDDLRPVVRERGGDVELAGIDQGVAQVRLTVSGCGSSASGVEDAVREAVLAVAPELSDVRRVPVAGGPDAAFIPLDALMRREAPSGVGP